MPTKEFILQLIKLLRPKFYNKLTWFLVVGGFSLVAPPLWSVIVNAILKENTNYQIIGEYDEWIGLFIIILALIFNVISQWTSNYESPKNVVKNAVNSTVNQAAGDIHVTNVINIHNPDKATMKQILDTIDYSNTKNQINFITQGNFKSAFLNLYASLPWVISIVKVGSSSDSKAKLTYKRSNGEEGQLLVRSHIVEEEKGHLKTEDSWAAFENGIPVLSAIYWSYWKIWTLNSVENSQDNKIELESAMMNDLSVIVGDISFVISELKMELHYDKASLDQEIPEHEVYGKLTSAFVLIKGEKVELEYFEMAIIDAFMDMEVTQEAKQGDKTIVQERNRDQHIIKLSSLIIRTMTKFGKDTSDNATEIVRRYIIELMNRIQAIHSYHIPNEKTNASDHLYEEAFGESSVIDRYNKFKSDYKKRKT